MIGYFKLSMKLAAALGEIGTLRAELARAYSQAEWFAAHVNELKVERAEMMNRAYGLALPVPTVEFQRPSVLPGSDTQYVPGRQVDMGAAPKIPIGDLLNQAREIRDANARAGNVAQTPGAVDFEDMGDEEAKQHGIMHTPTGEVAYVQTR